MIDLYDDRNGGLRAINQRVLEETSRICEQGMASIRHRNAVEEMERIEELYSTQTPYKK